jgi:carbamoyl-phosphate synthase small subunit
VKSEKGFLVLESGEVFPGLWQGQERAKERAGEVVFNTSHSGYEEMATDPSYFSQILVLTAPQQGNYGANDKFWESENIWIDGFVCVELQNSTSDSSWRDKLLRHQVPILTDVDTRALVFRLRELGTIWGALVRGSDPKAAVLRARELISAKKNMDKDWTHIVATKSPKILLGGDPKGPKIAAIDFGCKTNSLRELQARSREVCLFPPRVSAQALREYNPDGIFLSNGPGDPEQVQVAPETIRELLGWRFMFGICMGHQILGRALGGSTYKLKFGHRGSNHPIKDTLINKIYMTSQNHGYAVKQETLPKTAVVTQVNLNDFTVAGVYDSTNKVLGVQFHPESHPGPHEAVELFDFFIRQTR